MHIRILLSLALAVLAAGLAPAAIAQQLFYIHADHLNTPRLVTDGSGTPVWRWDQLEPFGDNLPNEDPDGNTILGHLPLRFPGQYFDKETNLAYNYYRDYDPAIGRYVQSDPIGLKGGMNLYTYVDADPLRSSDPMGLQSTRYYEKCVEEQKKHCIVVPLVLCAIPCVASGNIVVGGLIMAVCAPVLNQLCMREKEKQCARKWPPGG